MDQLSYVTTIINNVAVSGDAQGRGVGCRAPDYANLRTNLRAFKTKHVPRTRVKSTTRTPCKGPGSCSFLTGFSSESRFSEHDSSSLPTLSSFAYDDWAYAEKAAERGIPSTAGKRRGVRCLVCLTIGEAKPVAAQYGDKVCPVRRPETRPWVKVERRRCGRLIVPVKKRRTWRSGEGGERASPRTTR